MIPSSYIPSMEALEFISFIRASGNEDNSSPEFHYKIADSLFSPNKADWRLVIECLRGAGKSTLVEYAVIYAAAKGRWPGFGKVSFIAFLGASQEGNVKQFFKNVANKIERSPFISQVLKVTRQTDNELELENAKGNLLYLIGKGMNTNFRGLRSSGKKNAGQRPQIVIADDISDNSVITSEAARNTIDTNWYSSVLPALDPKKYKILYIATPLNEEDLLHKLKRSGEFKVEQYPLCPAFPCEEADFNSIWPDRFSFDYTSSMYRQFESAGKTQNFYCEYLLQITDLSTLLVTEDDLGWFDPTVVSKNKSGYNIYIATDFATSTKKNADYSVISVFAINNNNDWMLIDGQCKRQTMKENIDDIFNYARKWKPLSVGIETSGQQGGFLSILNEEMGTRNIWFSLARKEGSKEPGIRPTKDKMHRFVTGVQPKFKQGKILFPKPELVKNNPNLWGLVNEFLSELRRLTMAGGVEALPHDDAIDTLNQFAEMQKYTPSVETEVSDTYTKDINPAAIWASWDEEAEGPYHGNLNTVF